ncbi:MAG TPA: hypothetical protein DEB24_05200 [Coriobacteriia bacterium]|nr:hypothetical protein [Coriobacteriia bacterium]
MTKLRIDPGICGFIAEVEALTKDDMEAKVSVQTGCSSITGMIEELGDTYNAYEICLCRPGTGALYEHAANCNSFNSHNGCPVIAGIVKAIEVECKLALKKDVSFTFTD